MTVKRYMTALTLLAVLLFAGIAHAAPSRVVLNGKATIYHKTSCRYSHARRKPVTVRAAKAAGARPCKVCHRKVKAKIIKRKVRKVAVLGMSYRMCTPVQRAWLLSDCGSDD